MYSPEDQQIEICLLKANLEKIGDDLLVQNSALPALDEENEMRYRESMAALRVARALNADRERLNLENVKLTAKRMQLKQQTDDIAKSLALARERRDQLADLLKREERETELLIRKYEDSLRKKAEQFRKTSSFYNEQEMTFELEKVNNTLKELEEDVKYKEGVAKELKRQLSEIAPVVPEDILVILGKLEFNETIKELSSKYESLCEKHNQLLKSLNKK